MLSNGRDSYGQEKSESLFIHGHVIRQANAIGILIETSCIQAGLQLWRSLFEAYVVCEFFADNRRGNPQLLLDYISHSLLRSSIRNKENYNKLCKEKGKVFHYDKSDIDNMKSIFECRFGKSYADYSWAKPTMENTPKFGDFLDAINSELTIFYHLSSKEIHPTLGHRFALAGVSLPLPMIPMLPINHIFNVKEIYLEYLTAKILVRMTNRVGDFLILDEALRERLESLKTLGKDVLDKLKQ